MLAKIPSPEEFARATANDAASRVVADVVRAMHDTPVVAGVLALDVDRPELAIATEVARAFREAGWRLAWLSDSCTELRAVARPPPDVAAGAAAWPRCGASLDPWVKPRRGTLRP